ncbi:hypothetical protein Q5752_005572 [Cryptotrichosporon argae]
MPYISTEALIASAFLVVLALGWQYMPNTNGATPQGAAKKKKKAKRKGPADAGPPAGTRDEAREALGGKTADAGTGRTAASTPTPELPQPKPKTLADKLAPKRRKTKVDDMLPEEERTTSYARVMTISQSGQAAVRTAKPRPPAPPRAKADSASAAPPTLERAAEIGPKAEPAASSSKVLKYEADYADDVSDASPSTAATEEDDGWNVVAAKPKKPVSLTIGSPASTSAALSSSGDGLTKVQRKNAKKAEAKRAARAADEADRQRRLAMHKRELEREKINELYAGHGQGHGKGAAKVGRAKGATQQASITESGKLVWD